MGDRFGFVPVKMITGGLVCDAGEMGAENYVPLHLLYPKRGNASNCYLLLT